MPKYNTFSDAVDAIINAVGQGGGSTDLSPLMSVCEDTNSRVRNAATEIATVHTVANNTAEGVNGLVNYFGLNENE